MIDLRSVTRAQRWWSAKVLPLVAAAALSALVTGADAHEALPQIVALLISAAGLGAYAHLINDWSDIASDHVAAKPNQLAAVAMPARLALVATSAAVGIGPWFATGLTAPLWGAIGVLVALPIVYSAPPMRLKGRATAGVIADAANAHVVPMIFTMELIADGGNRSSAWAAAIASTLVWSASFGVRSILVHQLGDEAADRAARVMTFVVRHGSIRSVVVGRRAFGVEVVGLAGLWLVVVRTAPVAGAFLAAYLLVWALNLKWDHRPFNPTPRQVDAWMPLAEFYEVWPALALTGVLVSRDLAWWPLPTAIAFLFTGAITKQAVDLWHLLVPIGRDLRELLRRLSARAGRAAGWWVAGKVTPWVRTKCDVFVAEVRDVPWHLRVLWYDGWVGQSRYAIKRSMNSIWLFVRRQGRRFRRIVLRRPLPGR